MSPARRAALNGLVLLLCWLAAAPDGQGQPSYPARPVRLVVPYAAGGAVDALARPTAQKLAEQLGQPVVIENRPGAGSTLGADHVAKSAADGYTLLLGSIVNYTAPLFSKNVPYDPSRDLTAVHISVGMPNVLAVHPSLPVRSVAELVEYGRNNPGKLFYGTSGVGSTHHIGGIVLARTAGLEIEHVPYKGGNPTIADALAGSIPMVILTAATILPLAGSGKLRALGVIEDRRARIAPDLPAIRETLPAYHVPDLWFGFLGPANLPSPVVDRLRAELQRTFAAPEVRARLESLGFEILDAGGDLEARIRRDVEVFREIAVSAGIKPE